jgi:ABC-type multidrug transport system ATPase subunit
MYRFSLSDPQFLPHLACEVEFSVNHGELFCLLGENGLGKTSLMEKIFKKNLSHVAMVHQRPQDFFYDRELSKIKEIFFQSNLKEISQSKFQEYWKLFKLHEKEKRFLSSLSGGESQMLKLCLGLSVLRDVYFLDEPSQFLDDVSKVKLSEIIADLLKESKSIIMIEHDFSWVKLPMTICQLEIKNHHLSRGRTWSI